MKLEDIIFYSTIATISCISIVIVITLINMGMTLK